MAMTKEQFERYGRSYQRMEAAGGPKSQAEALLHHQYKQQQAAVAEAREMGKEQYQGLLVQRMQDVKRLEKEIAALKQQLQAERSSVDEMTEMMAFFENKQD